MRCERCHTNTARFTVTLQSKEGTKKAHLCPLCALTLPTFYTPSRPPVQTDVSCPVCGLKRSEFAESGKLGCSHCYDTFALDLADVLQRVQRTDHHVAPVNPSAVERKEQKPKEMSETDRLRDELKAAVAAEDYLRAATLRDQIKAGEEEL